MNKTVLHIKRLALLSCMAVASLTAAAQVNTLGEGYYRISNIKSGRYVHLMDNTGGMNIEANDADVAACFTISGKDNALCNPATVIYFREVDGGYALDAQGTSTWSIVQHPLQLRSIADGVYRCYASKSGVTVYLYDEDYQSSSMSGMGYLKTENKISNLTGKTEFAFNIEPINDTDNYLCVKPTIEANGKHYCPYYVSFPISLASSGMKAYTVTKVGRKALMTEVESSVIPAYTPVIIECSSATPSDNKLKIESSSASALSGNLLSGNFFCNTYPSHTHMVPWDKTKQRTLGVKNGKLALVTPTDGNIPANSAYYEADKAFTGDILLTTVASEAGLKGDVNGDNDVDILDVTLIIDNILNDTEIDEDAADVNGDGDIDIADVVAIIDIILNK